MQTHEENADQIIKRICECGWAAYLCGGAVRDNFLDVEPKDYDIVTDATPEELHTIFPDKKVKLVGANFLVTLVDDVEVATYRSDRNTGPNRHNCVTTACLTLDEDLARRDFTFNAVAVCPYSGDIIDPFNGLSDLNNKLVRFVGDPNDRIYEDYLRIIRAARFACLIEGRLEYVAAVAIRANRELVKQIAPERIRLELLKVMTYKKPSIFFDILHETGILKILFPELEAMYGHTGGEYHAETLDEHSKDTGDSLSASDPLLRLIGYLHDVGKVNSFAFHKDGSFIDHETIGADLVTLIFQRFRFTIKEIERARGLILVHMRSIDSLTTGKAIRRFLNTLAEHKIGWREWLRLKIADKNANRKHDKVPKEYIRKLCVKIHKASKITGKSVNVVDLAVNGHDIMEAFNLRPGPEVGNVLKMLLEVVIDTPSMNEKEQLLNFAREKCQSLIP